MFLCLLPWAIATECFTDFGHAYKLNILMVIDRANLHYWHSCLKKTISRFKSSQKRLENDILYLGQPLNDVITLRRGLKYFVTLTRDKKERNENV